MVVVNHLILEFYSTALCRYWSAVFLFLVIFGIQWRMLQRSCAILNLPFVFRSLKKSLKTICYKLSVKRRYFLVFIGNRLLWFTLLIIFYSSLPYRQLRNESLNEKNREKCSLPYRQLRNTVGIFDAMQMSSLPYRQLRKLYEAPNKSQISSLPYRQLRNVYQYPPSVGHRSLPYRQLRNG